MWRIEINVNELLECFDSEALQKQIEINPDFENSFLENTKIIRQNIEREAQKNRLKNLIYEYSRVYKDKEIKPIFYTALEMFIKCSKRVRTNVSIKSIFLNFLKIPTKQENKKRKGRPTNLEKCGLLDNPDFLDLLEELNKLNNN